MTRHSCPGIGGAMDLAVGAREIRIVMEHTGKKDEPRILKRCTYPLTAPGCVKRIYTSLAVIDVTSQGLVVIEKIPGMTLEKLQTLDRAEAATGLRLAGTGTARGPCGLANAAPDTAKEPLAQR